MAKTKKSKKEISLSCNPNILEYDHTDGKIVRLMGIVNKSPITRERKGRILSLRFQKEHVPANTLILEHVPAFRTVRSPVQF